MAISRLDYRESPGPVDLTVDSTGVKVCGQGAWHATQHGEKHRKSWIKLHSGVDDQGWIMASTLTDDQDQDPSQVPALLAQVDRELERFMGDGMYGQAPVYAAVEGHAPGARVLIPPRKDAVVSRMVASSPRQRDRHLLEIERTDRFAWKRTSGYDDQAHAENAFARYKRTGGGRLWARRDDAQEREASLACALLNRMRALGRPQSSPVS